MLGEPDVHFQEEGTPEDEFACGLAIRILIVDDQRRDQASEQPALRP